MRLISETVSASADFTEFTEAMFDTFYKTDSTRDYAIALWGHDSPEARKRTKGKIEEALKKEPNQVFRIVRDADAGGKIVCGTEWNVNVNCTPGMLGPWLDDLDWLEGEERKAAIEFLRQSAIFMGDAIKKVSGPDGEPHVRLMLMWTLPEYQGKGCGADMVKWGTALADHLGIPAWVEASLDGERLYSRSGFVEIQRNTVAAGEWSLAQLCMRRPPKVQDSPTAIDPR